MTTRHKHADVIIAWANGAEIEYRDHPTASWVSAGALNDLGWYEDYEYRVKPPAKKFRVALLTVPDDVEFTKTASNEDDASILERRPGFIRWLTDWVEYEG